ncbi:MAG: poly[(R)-3-hydroxyalkanoate] polymerase subunit PhaC, partial [Mycobacterium sp.]|nr:poly[(R)-3-hydroxyalkanoate] polymerase subunit PhaC [Mycobacterium sp.]
MSDHVEKDRNSGAEELAAPLDLLLTSSAVGVAERMLPNVAWSRFAINLARRPRTVASRAAALGRELAVIAEGRSELAPSKGDKRFIDPAWHGNPLLRRTMQAYLAANSTVGALFSDADLNWRDAERIRFVLDVLVEGLSPSNNPVLNPLGWKALIDTGGLSALRGLRHFLGDMRSTPRVPSMVEPDAFTLGEDIAVTPGSVVFRSEVFELIQYGPQTDKVGAVPLLVVPPVINKFYIMDIAPGRSMIEYLVRQGISVFAISWRNPTAEHRKWGFDTYGGAIVDALEAVEKISGSDRTHLQASCSGGMLAAMTAQHLTASGQGHRLASLTLMVTVLDQRKAGFAAAAIDEQTADIATALSARKGYLDGRTLAEVFAWLRPTDLVWRYWVNNYLEGKSPTPFDVLFWNADTTRMAAALHRDLVLTGTRNALATPGGVSMLGTPVDLSMLAVDTYVVAGVADHISPWQACYRSAQLLGSDNVRFVLSSSGHIASLVNPPGNAKA